MSKFKYYRTVVVSRKVTRSLLISIFLNRYSEELCAILCQMLFEYKLQLDNFFRHIAQLRQYSNETIIRMWFGTFFGIYCFLETVFWAARHIPQLYVVQASLESQLLCAISEIPSKHVLDQRLEKVWAWILNFANNWTFCFCVVNYLQSIINRRK